MKKEPEKKRLIKKPATECARCGETYNDRCRSRLCPPTKLPHARTEIPVRKAIDAVEEDR